MARRDERLTKRQTAELCGVDESTVKRRIAAGRYSNAQRGDGVSDPWLIPVTDLIAAGDYTPVDGEDVHGLLDHRAAAAEVVDLRRDLAVAQESRQRLEEQLAQLAEHLRFLQGLLTAATGCGCTRQAG